MSERGQPIDDAWYMDYAAGSIASRGEAVLLACHMELNDAANERVSDLERVGAAVMMASGGKRPGFDFDAVLDRIDAEDGLAGQTAPTRSPEDYVPVALQNFLLETGKEIHWEFLAPGMRKAMLWTGDEGERLWLLKAEPGMAIPHHGHHGSELTLVLKGSFHDGDRQFVPGDVEEAGPDTEHDIRIDDAGECICLAVTHGKLRYDNPLLKLMQVFTGL